MSDWKNEVTRLRLEENMPWSDIIDRYQGLFPEKTHEQIRKKLSDVVRKAIRADATRASVQDRAFHSSNGWKNGHYESDRLIEICDTAEITPELILTLHGLSPSKWEVISYLNNKWHSQKKGGKRLIMYQSKLSAKPVYGRIDFEDIEAYFEGKVYAEPPRVTISDYDPTGETLEIDVADPHNGLLAWVRETGADYDIHIARERFMKVIADNIERCQGRKFKKIILALLGDLLHIDNDLQTTTKGTFQQADGRIAKIFESTLDGLVDAVRMLGDIAPIEVIYTSGNHDGTSGWMLIKALEMAFKSDPNVEIDVEPNPQKARLIGNSLVGFVHGDMPEKNLSGWLQVTARKLSEPVRFMEVHAGHRHAQKVKERLQTEENEGVVVRTMPTIANSSTWEHREGYAGTTCTSMSFVWHNECGLREMWYYSI